jgi:hypothetical protein
MHVEPRQALQQALDTDQVIEGKGPIAIVVDQHVQIAVLTFLAARSRTEERERSRRAR